MSDDQAIERTLDKFRAGGGRVTAARREIVAALLSGDHHEHLTAEEIGRRVQERHPEIAPSTVYRSLETLAELGVLDQVRMGNGPAVFHLVHERHVHLVCRSCDTVVEVDADELADVARRLEDRTGFAIEPGRMAIAGLCADCRSDT